MSGPEILLIVVAVLLVAAVGAAVWIRRRRKGHVLIADRPESRDAGRRP